MRPTTPAACADLSRRELVRQTLQWQAIGLALLVCHVALSKISIVLFFPLGLLGLTWLYYKAPLAGLLVFFQWLIYQNWIVSLLSVGMEYSTYSALQGSSFAALVLLAAVAFFRLPLQPRWRTKERAILWTVMAALLAASIYAFYGMTKAGLGPAAVYFREATSLVFAVLIGLDVGRVWGYRTIGHAFVISAILGLAIAGIEIASPEEYYDVINAPNYVNLKYTNLDPSSGNTTSFFNGADLVNGNTTVFLNISGDEGVRSSFRFMGTVLHSVSFGYVLAGICLIAVSLGEWFWLCCAWPLLLLSGIKGPNLLFLVSVCLWVTWYTTRSRFVLLSCGILLMICYVGFGLAFGEAAGDLHVLGFLGGVKGFLSDPIGHGLGVGGNFSPQGARALHWGQVQRFGADFALESAVGVLIYQMGVAAAAVFSVIVCLLWAAPLNENKPTLRDIAFIALAAAAVNGVFQEEAYTPYACGLFTLFAGVLIANGFRSTAVVAPTFTGLRGRVAARGAA